MHTDKNSITICLLAIWIIMHSALESYIENIIRTLGMQVRVQSTHYPLVKLHVHSVTCTQGEYKHAHTSHTPSPHTQICLCYKLMPPYTPPPPHTHTHLLLQVLKSIDLRTAQTLTPPPPPLPQHTHTQTLAPGAEEH